MWSFVVFSGILIIANGEHVPVPISLHHTLHLHPERGNPVPINIHHTLHLERGNPVDMDIGQGNQIYCKLLTPKKDIAFDGFGRCRLTLDRVGSEHEGNWSAYIGYSGRVTLAEEIITVVLSRPGQPDSVNDIVKTMVTKLYPRVILRCMLPRTPRYKVQSCQFRGPAGQVLLASGSFDEELNVTRHYSKLEEFACSVTIFDPKEYDVGWWRCAVKTENGTYYTFMDDMVHKQGSFNNYAQDRQRGLPIAYGRTRTNQYGNYHYIVPSVRDRTIQPSYPKKITGLENEPVTLSCSIDARIRYCYFKDNNGTIIPVFPGLKSSSMEYVGSGFNAGECGIKMTLPVSKAEGQEWSCNIGLVRGLSPKEYQSKFIIYMEEYMHVAQDEFGHIIVTASTYNNGGTPEYCRFMRSDGQRFTYDASPAPPIQFQGYITHNGKVSGRICTMTVYYPTSLDKQPWTVFAKLPDFNGEVMKQSSGIVVSKQHHYISHSRFPGTIVSVAIVSLITIMALVALLVIKKKRQWISSRIAKRTSAVQNLLLRGKNPPTQNDEKIEKLPLPVTAASSE